MVRLRLKVSKAVKDILDMYEINKLLGTIPTDYKMNPAYLKVYLSKSNMTEVVDIELTDSHLEYLNNMAKNYNIKASEMLAFLVEMVCNCGKINTKAISRAIDNYYSVVNNMWDSSLSEDTRQKYKDLYKELLDEYSESGYGDDKDGNTVLSEEAIVRFLDVTNRGKELQSRIEALNNN